MKPFIKKDFFFIAVLSTCPILYGMEYQQQDDALKMIREADGAQQELFFNARRNRSIALMVINTGANSNGRDRGDRTPFIKATGNCCSEVKLQLIAEGAQDTQGLMSLMNVVYLCPVELVVALLKAGKKKDRYKYTVWRVIMPEGRAAIEALNDGH